MLGLLPAGANPDGQNVQTLKTFFAYPATLDAPAYRPARVRRPLGPREGSLVRGVNSPSDFGGATRPTSLTLLRATCPRLAFKALRPPEPFGVASGTSAPSCRTHALTLSQKGFPPPRAVAALGIVPSEKQSKSNPRLRKTEWPRSRVA